MLVFRDDQRRASSVERCRELHVGISALSPWLGAESAERCATLLLLAAELECALSDLAHERRALAAELCDELALSLLAAEPPLRALPLVRELCAGQLPAELEFVRPEGYAYYGLDPRSYAALARTLRLGTNRPLVVGVRSIGVSLSALFCAALRRRGALARRITLRPAGHPFARSTQFSPSESRALELGPSSEVFVVDEGPGLSGSTFLAVAEALVAAGVAHEHIHLCCSHAVDPGRLIAEDAERRWSRFRTLVAPRTRLPRPSLDLSGGAWRRLAYARPSEWPACWSEQERSKFKMQSADAALWKFQGVPPYDREPRARAELLWDAGFGPRLRGAQRGYFAFDWYGGGSLRHGRGTAPLARIARYLAFRKKYLHAAVSSTAALEQMTALNVAEALGVSLPRGFRLELESPVVPDARMMPYEWLKGDGVEPIKVDGIDHGDDHLLPGPTDIAWDLAGAAVEWDLAADEILALLEEYRRQTGDDPKRRFRPYAIAYCALRVGACTLALLTAGAAEGARLGRARAHYEGALRSYLA